MTLRALRVIGPFRGPSGYEHHVRAFVRELHRRGVKVELIDLPEWGPAKLPDHLRDPWFETLDRPVDAQVLLQFCMPHQVVTYDGLISVNFTMFEATRVPPRWVAAARRCALTVLPTKASLQAWIASGAPESRLRLCPLGVDTALF